MKGIMWSTPHVLDYDSHNSWPLAILAESDGTFSSECLEVTRLSTLIYDYSILPLLAERIIATASQLSL